MTGLAIGAGAVGLVVSGGTALVGLVAAVGGGYAGAKIGDASVKTAKKRAENLKFEGIDKPNEEDQ